MIIEFFNVQTFDPLPPNVQRTFPSPISIFELPFTSTAANKYAVVRSFGSSLVAGCSEKSSVNTKSFESYSELVSSSLEMKVLKKKFLGMN